MGRQRRRRSVTIPGNEEPGVMRMNRCRRVSRMGVMSIVGRIGVPGRMKVMVAVVRRRRGHGVRRLNCRSSSHSL